MNQQPRGVDELWIQHQRRNCKTTQSWACVHCLDRKIFSDVDELWQHGLSAHQDQFSPPGATWEKIGRLRTRYEEESAAKRRTKDDWQPRKPAFNHYIGTPESLPPPRSLAGLRHLNIGTRDPGGSEDIAMEDVSNDAEKLDKPVKRAAIGDGISAGSASSYRDVSAAPPPRRSKARPISASGPAETETRQSSMSQSQPLEEKKRLWSPDDWVVPTSRTLFDPPTMASVQTQKLRAQTLQRNPRKAYPGQSLGSMNLRAPLAENTRTAYSARFGGTSPTEAAVKDDHVDIILLPETRPISQEQLVAEVKAIYAGLVTVEAKCIEVDNKQANAGAPPKLNTEHWQALIALHRTLLHEHHDFFLASQQPSASPALRRLATKYSMPARMWRHGMISFLESLKDRLPDSLCDLRHKLTFMELAYTMMDLLRKANPSFEDMWKTCLADFNRNLASMREDSKDETTLASQIREWFSDVSTKCSMALPYLPKVYTKSSSFFRKAIRVSVNGIDCLARPDTGSESDVCSEAFAKQRGLLIRRNEEDKTTFRLGTMTEVRSIGRVLVMCGLPSDLNPPEERWLHVLKYCVAPIIMGERFIKKIGLYEQNKHLLVRCPNWFGSLPTLKYLGSSNNQIRFSIGGHSLFACPDTGSDEDFMSLACAKRYGFKINRRRNTRIMVQQADGSIVMTLGQVCVPVNIGLMDEFQMKFHILDGLASEVILSEEFLEQTDSFQTLVEPLHTSNHDVTEPQKTTCTLNTLVNLGPINAYANRSLSTILANTPEQEHDNPIVTEIWRRNKANKAIAKIWDDNERRQAADSESIRKRDFDQSHADCAICIQRSNHEPSKD